jgi:hypothetical protein
VTIGRADTVRYHLLDASLEPVVTIGRIEDESQVRSSTRMSSPVRVDSIMDLSGADRITEALRHDSLMLDFFWCLLMGKSWSIRPDTLCDVAAKISELRCVWREVARQVLQGASDCVKVISKSSKLFGPRFFGAKYSDIDVVFDAAELGRELVSIRSEKSVKNSGYNTVVKSWCGGHTISPWISFSVFCIGVP